MHDGGFALADDRSHTAYSITVHSITESPRIWAGEGLSYLQARPATRAHIAVIVLRHVHPQIIRTVNQPSLDGRGVLGAEGGGHDEGATKPSVIAVRIDV